MASVTFYPGFSIKQLDPNLPSYLRWWRKECPVYVPRVMVGYGTVFAYLKSDADRYVYNDLRKNFKMEEAHVIADSGGFQIAIGKNVDLNVGEVVEWQYRNADVVVGLDLPPTNLGRVRYGTEIEKYAVRSAKNYEKQLKYLDSVGGKKFMVVLHGTCKVEMDTWWKVAVEPFVGVSDYVAYPPHPKTSSQVAFALAYLSNKGVKNVHILAGSGELSIATMSLFRGFFNEILFDSSTFSRDAGWMKMYIPTTTKSVSIGVKGVKKGSVSVAGCSCPACTKIVYASTDVVLELHNLFQVAIYTDKVNWLPEKVLLKVVRENVAKFYTVFKDSGFDTAYEMFVRDTSIRVHRKPRKGGVDRWL